MSIPKHQLKPDDREAEEEGTDSGRHRRGFVAGAGVFASSMAVFSFPPPTKGLSSRCH